MLIARSSLQYFLALRLLCKGLKLFSSFFFVSNPMEKRVECLGCDVAFNGPSTARDGDCVFARA